MAVYDLRDRNNYYGFWENLGNQGAGIVANLIGQQIGAMVDRGKQASQVEAARSVMGDYANYMSGNPNATEADALTAMMSSKNWGKLSPEQQKLQLELAAKRGANSGQEEFRTGALNGGFGDPWSEAQTQTTIGALRGGWNPAVQSQFLERTMPETQRMFVDTGDKMQGVEYNKYAPGIVQSLGFKKSVSPGDTLNAQVMRERLNQERELEASKLAVTRRGQDIQAAIAGGKYDRPVAFEVAPGKYQYFRPDGTPYGQPIIGSLIGNRNTVGGNSEMTKLQADFIQKEIAAIDKTLTEGMPTDEEKAQLLDDRRKLALSALGVLKMSGQGGSNATAAQTMSPEDAAAKLRAIGATPEQIKAAMGKK